jgi:hypothetical protein
VQERVQQLPGVHPPPPINGEDQAEHLRLLEGDAGLPVHGLNPPEREPRPQERDEEPDPLRPRQGASCTTGHAGEQQVREGDQR